MPKRTKINSKATINHKNMKQMEFMSFSYLIFFSSLKADLFCKKCLHFITNIADLRTNVSDYQHLFLYAIYPQIIHGKIKNIHLKKCSNALSCASSFNTTLHVVFKMNKSHNLQTTLYLLHGCYSTSKSIREGSHNE